MNQPAKTPWVAQHHRRDPRASVRLFCFPYAGGSASVFASWKSLLPPEVELCPVQYPGRNDRISEPHMTDVCEMADVAAKAIGPYLDMSFALFGHSLGALVAYEVAQALRRTGGARPKHLIVSAHRAPHIPLRREPTWQLDGASFKSRLQELNGTPKEVFDHEELLALVLPLLRADFRLAETYTHPGNREPLDCPITLFGGRDDADVNEAELSAWRETTRGPFEMKMMEGDHFFINSQKRELLQDVSRLLLGCR